jgi:hypothetical protein
MVVKACVVVIFIVLLLLMGSCAITPRASDQSWAHIQKLIADQQETERGLLEFLTMYRTLQDEYARRWQRFRYELSTRQLELLERAITYENRESIEALSRALSPAQEQKLLWFIEGADHLKQGKAHIDSMLALYQRYGQLIQEASQLHQSMLQEDASRQALINQQMFRFRQQLNQLQTTLMQPPVGLRSR